MESDLQEPERFRSPAYRAVLDERPATAAAHFTAAAYDAMTAAAESGYPLEVCGLLIGTVDATGWRIDQCRQVANLNEDRAADRFQLDPAAYQRIDRELRGSGLEIIGVFHSHPDCPAKPSPTDLDHAWEGLLYPIVSVHAGKTAGLRCWALNDDGTRFREVEQKAKP